MTSLSTLAGRFGLSLAAMQEVSRTCGSTGFLTWCHDVCGLYMEQSGNPTVGASDDGAGGKEEANFADSFFGSIGMKPQTVRN